MLMGCACDSHGGPRPRRSVAGGLVGFSGSQAIKQAQLGFHLLFSSALMSSMAAFTSASQSTKSSSCRALRALGGRGPGTASAAQPCGPSARWVAAAHMPGLACATCAACRHGCQTHGQQRGSTRGIQDSLRLSTPLPWLHRTGRGPQGHLNTCSGWMVFFFSLVATSLDCDATRLTNSAASNGGVVRTHRLALVGSAACSGMARSSSRLTRAALHQHVHGVLAHAQVTGHVLLDQFFDGRCGHV